MGVDTITSPIPAARRRYLTPAERRTRNEQIAEARDANATWLEIAKRFGVSPRHARRAYREHQDTVRTAFDVVRRAVERHELPEEKGTA